MTARTQPSAAVGPFPYCHRTVAEVDADPAERARRIVDRYRRGDLYKTIAYEEGIGHEGRVGHFLKAHGEPRVRHLARAGEARGAA